MILVKNAKVDILMNCFYRPEINPTIMRRRCLLIVIYSVHGHSMGSYRDAYKALPCCGVTGVTSDAVVPSTCRL